jgi:hypothetical protein
MLTFTNLKIAGFSPVWATYRGFSLLFDNSSDGLASPGVHFYDRLNECLEKLQHDGGRSILTTAFLFCPLPREAYHVTVWDGISDGNISKVKAGGRLQAADFLAQLRDSPDRESPCDVPNFLEMVLRHQLVSFSRTITLSFAGLRIWGNDVLVATLRPGVSAGTDAHSRASTEVYAGMLGLRADLNGAFAGEHGVAARDEYVPHVSLGYFANAEHAELAKPRLADWNATFQDTMAGLQVRFTSIGLYTFTSMAQFRRFQRRSATREQS